MELKTTDRKGRVCLGAPFANVPVHIEPKGEGEWTIRVVEAIPAREMWLAKNKDALNLVTTGILQAQNREFAEDPMKGRDYSWLEEVGDNVQESVDSRSRRNLSHARRSGVRRQKKTRRKA